MRRGLRMAFAGLLAASLFGVAPQALARSQFVGTKVAVKDNFFKPKTVTITVGTKVKWTNKGILDHTTTSDSKGWNKTLAPGQSFVYKFITPGTYTYHCNFHFGMNGKVIVNP